MITALSVDEILDMVVKTPEQLAFDWKRDFTLPKDDGSRGELVKDIAAIANASPLSYGFIVYGVDPRRPDPLVGISANYDDSRIQQLVKGKIEPFPNFLYYEASRGPKSVAVIQIAPSRKRPFIISIDIGKVRAGQIVIRRGSSTDGAHLDDLVEFFYGPHSAYFENVRSRLNLDVQRLQAETNHLAELRRGADDLRDQISGMAGLPSQRQRR